ncbi:unnamed protein product, partial [Symbiodinium microadriaticum]
MPLAKVTPDLASYKAALRACEAGGLRELALRLLKSSSVVDEQSDRCPERLLLPSFERFTIRCRSVSFGEVLPYATAHWPRIVCPERYMPGAHLLNMECVAHTPPTPSQLDVLQVPSTPGRDSGTAQFVWKAVCVRGRGRQRASDLCPAGLMCEVATAIEPQLCEPKTFDIRLQREREKICVYGIGQQFVEYARLLTVPRVANRFGWSQDQDGDEKGSEKGEHGGIYLEIFEQTLLGGYRPERLQQSFDTIAAEFKTANVRTPGTAAERDIDFQSPGFDGLTLLNITDDEFREDLVILYPQARSYLHHYIEKLWNFRRPLPCPAGAYCNAGTCPRYLLTGIVDVDFDRPSNALEEARRLAETHYTEKLREVFYNRTWNVTIPPDMEQGEEMGGHANDSNDSSWSPLNRSDRWDKPSDCFDKNETEPQEGKTRTSAPKQDATFENFRVLSEFQQMSTETLGAPAPLQRLNEPMHQQYAVGKAASLAPELAFRQLLAHRKELSEQEWLRLWTNFSADIASKIWPNASANVSLGNWTWFAQNASGENITRRLQEETFLATTEYPLEAINPLSMRAP